VSLVESMQDDGQHVTEPPTNERPPASTQTPVVAVRRRTIDAVLVGAGAVIAVVLAVAGSLLTWGSNFANDYVGKELTSQHINFPDRASLEKEGRQDLFGYAGQQVTTGTDARAYASFIAHHLDGIADGATYADLGAPEAAAKAQVQAATDAGKSTAAVAELQTKADAITAQRNTLFKGETLRGLLLSTFAWSTIGRIAGIAATVAFVAAGVMTLLVILGVFHLRKARTTA
jgi:hypothetical protein